MSEQTNQFSVLESGLVTVYEDQIAERFVDGRELHEKLAIGRDYTTWIKERLRKYGFTEGEDYLLLKTGEQQASGTKHKTDYWLKMDVAKEIAMVQNNEQGRAVRKYFIAIEKQHREKLIGELLQIKKQDQTVLGLQRQTLELKTFAEFTKAATTLAVSFGMDKVYATALVNDWYWQGKEIHMELNRFAKDKVQQAIQKKRGRVYVRVQRLGTLIKKLNPMLVGSAPYEEAWHLMADEMVFEAGMTKNMRKRHEEDKKATAQKNLTLRLAGTKKLQPPGYLDYIQEGDLFKEAEKVLDRLIKQYAKQVDAE